MQSQQVAPERRNVVPLIALLTANAISMVGNVLVMVAIPWFVLQTTESAAKTGITAVFTIVPTILSTFFGGPLIDRLGYKRVSIIADLASGVAVALIPLLYLTIGLEFWQLLILVFFGALLGVKPALHRRVYPVCLSVHPSASVFPVGLAGGIFELCRSSPQ